MNTSTFAHAKDDKKATKLFDKTGKNYIDCILDFIDNAKTSSVDVEDIEELEERFNKIKEQTQEIERKLQAINDLQDELLNTLTQKSIKPLAERVVKYFKNSGYLDGLDTEIQQIYMQRWAKHIVEYMQRHHIPLVKIDLEKVSMEVAKYLMEHCRKCKCCDGKGYCDTCDYIPEGEYEHCHCVCSE